MLKLVHYLNDRGGNVIVDKLMSRLQKSRIIAGCFPAGPESTKSTSRQRSS